MELQKYNEPAEGEQKIIARSRDIITAVNMLKIDCDEDSVKAADLAGMIKGALKHAEDERTSMTKPLNEVIGNINLRFRNVREPLEKAEKALKGKMLEWHQLKQAEIREAEEAAEKERKRLADIQAAKDAEARAKEIAEAKEMGEEPPAPRPTVELVAESDLPPRPIAKAPMRGSMGATVSVKTVLDFEVTNIAHLAAHDARLVEVNSGAVRKMINAGVKDIPGIRIIEKEQVAVR